jgi:hypothetical protein
MILRTFTPRQGEPHLINAIPVSHRFHYRGCAHPKFLSLVIFYSLISSRHATDDSADAIRDQHGIN